MTDDPADQLPVRIGSTTCSPELWQRLTDPKLGWEQGSILAANAANSELSAVVAALEAAAAPCGPEAVIAALTPLTVLYHVDDKTPAAWTRFWKFYIDALEHLPKQALADGVREYNAKRDANFFPKPGPLRAVCEARAATLLTALGRGRRALRLAGSGG